MPTIAPTCAKCGEKTPDVKVAPDVRGQPPLCNTCWFHTPPSR